MLISLKTDYTMKQPAVRVYSCICTSSDGQSTGKSVVELIWPHWNIWLCWEKHRHTYFHPPFLSSLSLWQQKQKNYISAHVTIKNKPKKIGLWEKDKDRKSPGTKKESISQHAVAKCSITCSAAAEEFSAGGPPWSGAQTLTDRAHSPLNRKLLSETRSPRNTPMNCFMFAKSSTGSFSSLEF